MAFAPHAANCADSRLGSSDNAHHVSQSRAQTCWFVADYGIAVTVSSVSGLEWQLLNLDVTDAPEL